MTTKPLFLDASVKFEKVAYSAKMDDDHTQWPSEVIKEAYKQLPYLQKYETDVEIERADASRGYGVGRMLVYPARMTKHAATKVERLVSFPIIIRDRELAPLDVFSFKEEMRPESESSVNELLFRPDIFEATASRGTHQGTSLVNQTSPPVDGGGQKQISKTSSVHSEGLWKIANPTFKDADVAAFKQRLRDDIPLRRAYTTEEHLRGAMEDLLAHKEVTASDLRDVRSKGLNPTAIQISEKGIGYTVKTANHSCFAPESQDITRFDAQDILSSSAMEKLSQKGHVTLCRHPVNSGKPIEKTAQEATRMGVYTTRSGGKEVHGIVVPQVISFDGTPVDMQIFAGSGEHALQEKVAGVFKEDVVLPDTRPYGKGVFVYQEGPMAVATEPVEVTNRSTISDGTEKIAQYHARSLAYGTPLKFTVVQGLKKIASIGDFEIAIPSEFRFLPLNGPQVKVAQTPEDADLFSSREAAGADSVEVVSDGSMYSLRGKNAGAFKDDILSHTQTEFALAALGVAGSQAEGVLKTAAADGSFIIPVTRPVLLESSLSAALLTKAASAFAEIDVSTLKADLVKEASVIIDKETADAILSLNFLTPENASIYVDFIPELEKVSSKLAELLVASRLGMDDIREAAAKNAMSQVSSVVRGLDHLKSKIQ